MRVLFIHSSTESLGLEYLSSSLKQRGHTTALLFEPFLFRSFRLDSRALDSSSAPKLAAEALAWKPDLVGFSVESDYFGWACEVTKEIKKLKNVPVIFGGVHASSVPELTLELSGADYVCAGEGEETICELADCLENDTPPDGIANLLGKGFNNPPRNLEENLDKLPFPDKNLFYDKFPRFASGSYSIITGRGCPNACSYCHNSAMRGLYQGKGRYLRRRSPENVINELLDAKTLYGSRRVSFVDDLFTENLPWLRVFLREYKAKIGLPFYCDVHPSFIDEERVSLLAEAGCSVVNMGIQTIDPEISSGKLNRRPCVEDAARAIELFRGKGIFLFTNFMFGLPGQTTEELEKIAAFCAEHKADFHDVNWLRYYPGARIMETAKADGLLTGEEVVEINRAEKFLPYAHGGHSYSPERSRLRNLVFLFNLLPAGAARKLLSWKFYRFLPAFDLRGPAVAACLLVKKYLLGKKNPYPNFSISDIAAYYLHFTVKKLFSGGGA